MTNRPSDSITRRRFVQTTAVGAAATLAAPAIVTAQKTDSGPIVTGEGEHRYEVDHNWAKLPKGFSWATTQNVAIDSDGLVYVIHYGRKEQADPTVLVFDPEGEHVRSFGAEFSGGGHGIEIRNEGGQDFVYVAAFKEQRSCAKLDTKGEIVWRKGAPMESGRYTKGEDKFPRKQGDDPWGRNRFNPTNTAFLPDGGFVLADGYGAWTMHRYNAAGEWVSNFGKPGNKQKADGTFSLPHGVWLDDRPRANSDPDSDEPLICVADRQFDRLQWFTLDGEHRQTLDGFYWPANVDTWRDLMVVPELKGRVTLLGKDNQVLARLGDDSERILADKKLSVRGNPKLWQAGKFVHPHDACFDADGNIYVAEWVGGRVTKLKRLT